MHPPHEFGLDLLQLGPRPLRHRLPLEREAPGSGLPADVREAQAVERLRLAETTLRPVRSGVPPELDQPRLLGLQLQPELHEPLAQLGEEPLRIRTMLEAHDEVVRIAHDDHVAARLSAPPSLDPL